MANNGALGATSFVGGWFKQWLADRQMNREQANRIGVIQETGAQATARDQAQRTWEQQQTADKRKYEEGAASTKQQGEQDWGTFGTIMEAVKYGAEPTPELVSTLKKVSKYEDDVLIPMIQAQKRAGEVQRKQEMDKIATRGGESDPLLEQQRIQNYVQDQMGDFSDEGKRAGVDVFKAKGQAGLDEFLRSPDAKQYFKAGDIDEVVNSLSPHVRGNLHRFQSFGFETTDPEGKADKVAEDELVLQTAKVYGDVAANPMQYGLGSKPSKQQLYDASMARVMSRRLEGELRDANSKSFMNVNPQIRMALDQMEDSNGVIPVSIDQVNSALQAMGFKAISQEMPVQIGVDDVMAHMIQLGANKAQIEDLFSRVYKVTPPANMQGGGFQKAMGMSNRPTTIGPNLPFGKQPVRTGAQGSPRTVYGTERP